MEKLRRFALLPLLIVLMLAGAAAAGETTEEHYYAIELNGTLCGYAHIQSSPAEFEGKPTILLEQRMFMMLSALGSEFNTEILLTFHIDPATRQYLYHDAEIEQGRTKLGWTAQIEGDTARVTSILEAGEKTVALPPEVILADPLYAPYLRKAFVEGGAETKTFEVFEATDAEVQRMTYTLVGTEEVELAGRRFDTVILDVLNLKTGIKARTWIDRETAQMLKANLPNNRVFYLADASVVKQIELVNLDENLTARVNVSIPDIQAITRMKVRATLEPSGLWITPESLNVPGQSFTGTVEENRIEGIFEIEHKRYDGTNAPPFPPDFSGDESLQPYLEPAGLIESDDLVLVEKAQEITRGSKDSWEAVHRLSAWVAENIDYAIPGGGTARKTYDTRTGECGSHSNLVAAFSRAVGIPARVIWGCMYIPNFGGAFGQHGWNEVYMGDAGWIPLDATANETDYVDSGHIRVGVHESAATALNPVALEVLDYRVGTGEMQAVDTSKYDSYVGEYTNPETQRTMTVLVQDGSLAVDVPGQVVLALNDADEEGAWTAKLSDRVFIAFERNDAGEVVEMQIHEIVRMQRTSAPEQIDEEIPEQFRPHLGKYLFAPVNAEFTVIYRDGSLAVEDPLNKKTIGLQLPDDKGRWVDEFGKNAISFDREEEGFYQTLVIDAANRFLR
jgi:transglutaminase-like putative cysteine protease